MVKSKLSGKSTLALIALAFLLLAWALSSLAPGLTARYVGRFLQEKGYSGVQFEVSKVSLFYLHMKSLKLHKGRHQLSAENAYLRFSPLKLVLGELDTLYLERATIRLDMAAYANEDRADNMPGMDADFTIPFRKILIPDGDIVFVGEGFRRSLPLSGIVLKNEEGLVEATFSAGREGRSILLEVSLQTDTLNGGFNYALNWENFSEWLEIAQPILDLSLPEGSGLDIFVFSGEGRGEFEGGKLTSLALVGSSESADGILPDGLLINEEMHIGLRQDFKKDHFEAALSGHAELLDWRSWSVGPFDYVFHQGQDEILRGEVSESAFSHGEWVHGRAGALMEIDAGREDSDEVSFQVSFNLAEVNFLGHLAEPFDVEVLGALNQMEFSIPNLKFPKEGIVLEEVFGELMSPGAGIAETAPARTRSVLISFLNLGELQIEGVEVEFAVGENGIIQVGRLWGNILGARVECEPFAYVPGNPEFTLSMKFSELPIKEAARVLSGFEGEAEGFLEGVLEFKIGREGVHLLKGFFELDGERQARLRYSREDGLSKGLAPGSAEFLEMKRAQEYLADILLHSLEIELSDPQINLNPIDVRIAGNPASGTGPVDFELALPQSENVKIIRQWARQIESLFLPQIQ